MPTINLDGEVTVLATVPEVIEALESCAMTWQKLISTALEEQLKKVPQVMLPITPSASIPGDITSFPHKNLFEWFVLIFNPSSCLIFGKPFTN